MSVYVIAEAGVNHNGNFKMACKMVDAARSAGADCIKFQTFKTDMLVSTKAQKADYQRLTMGDGSQYDMLKSLELSFADFLKLKNYCDKVGITFLSTPFDFESLDYLATLDMPFWKIPSGEVTNLPLLERIASTHKPVVMSTGMCSLDEIRESIGVLKNNGTSVISLLHCNTEYPTPYEDVNLKAMETLKREFDCEVGYSDHTMGIEVPIAAVCLGATIIEKHFTLDKNLPGPDHKASLEPKEFAEMVSGIRNTEKALGTELKQVSNSERKNISATRKSIVASRQICKGEILSEQNITVKRPGNGLSPMRWYEVIGTKAIKDYNEDDYIEI